jgi:hypothetical protein
MNNFRRASRKHLERESIVRQNRILSHSRWECKYYVLFIPKCCKEP